jgi:uncharacterized membrane protein YkvA (DUF1232 family)
MAGGRMAKKEESQPQGEDLRDLGFWRETWQQLRLVLALLRDPDVPLYLKLLPAAAVLYVLFPLDFVPDLYPVLGQIDDLTALVVGAKVFVEMAPPHVVARHLERLRAGGMAPDESEDPLKDAIVIDAEHTMLDREEEPPA